MNAIKSGSEFLDDRYDDLAGSNNDPDASLQALLSAVAAGKIAPDDARDRLRHFDFEPVDDFAKVDHHRSLRTGFPEAIWGPGKTPEQIVAIFRTMSERVPVALATRIEPEVFQQLQVRLPELHYHPTARICVLQTADPPQYPGAIGILTAGTVDIPVAEEAAVTAELSGFEVQRLWDVGVAGIHRLLSHRTLLDRVDVAIVVAGMEGALPSVVAGMAACPVIAVPTSVGYGTSFGGIAPLLTMLNSCATGIGVMNVDNGFGAAMLAGKILRTAARLHACEGDTKRQRSQ
ncbi:NCAIR mutase (PurE)-related protein [Rubidibacter lacunae KORDI 51-2]|uniref:NCAIR mutase (PurE)-related protein n=1 Tax=Rubidibacter lacunae KORDI 51-2 TaxID=582515 RepID=U5DKT5_9CHRO|nr:nickel pincer cofactor biosynthesis protein LarB [Rubidibacter lacunae]ERN40335.1 NCAIR mutase (PurE)-related protein [Rubidibacter lacunae KORDI 51-2]